MITGHQDRDRWRPITRDRSLKLINAYASFDSHGQESKSFPSGCLYNKKKNIYQFEINVQDLQRPRYEMFTSLGQEHFLSFGNAKATVCLQFRSRSARSHANIYFKKMSRSHANFK